MSTDSPTPCEIRPRRPGPPSPGHFPPGHPESPDSCGRAFGRPTVGPGVATMRCLCDTGQTLLCLRRQASSSLSNLPCGGRLLVLQTDARLLSRMPLPRAARGVARDSGGGIGRVGDGPLLCLLCLLSSPVFSEHAPCPRASHTRSSLLLVAKARPRARPVQRGFHGNARLRWEERREDTFCLQVRAAGTRAADTCVCCFRLSVPTVRLFVIHLPTVQPSVVSLASLSTTIPSSHLCHL